MLEFTYYIKENRSILSKKSFKDSFHKIGNKI